MNNRLWKEVIRACSFEGLTPKVTVHYADGTNGRPMLITFRHVINKDTGKFEEIGAAYDLSLINIGFRPAPPFAMARVIFDIVSGNLQHEAGEHFRFQGKQLFDPHVK